MIPWQTMHFFMDKHHAWCEATGLLCKPPAGLMRSGLCFSEQRHLLTTRLQAAEEVDLLRVPSIGWEAFGNCLFTSLREVL